MLTLPNRLVNEQQLTVGGWRGQLREWLTVQYAGGKAIEIACAVCQRSRIFTEAEFRRTQAIEPCQCRAHADTMRQFPPAA